MANVRSTQDPRRVVRSVFIPLVAVAGVLAALVLGLILSGRQSGLAPTLLPLIALAGTALLGLLLFPDAQGADGRRPAGRAASVGAGPRAGGGAGRHHRAS